MLFVELLINSEVEKTDEFCCGWRFELFSYRLLQFGASLFDLFCFLCFVFAFVILFLAALLSTAGKGLTSWLSGILCFLVLLSLFHTASWVRCDS